jgi:hypothetical protein
MSDDVLSMMSMENKLSVLCYSFIYVPEIRKENRMDAKRLGQKIATKLSVIPTYI